MNQKIIPTVFAENKREFKERFEKLIKIAEKIQIDFMDGKFVKSKSIDLKDVPALKGFKNEFEAHLMVLHPEKLISELQKKGFGKVIFHYEAVKDNEKINEIIKNIKSKKMEAWLAINPETKVEKIFPFLREINGVLFLGVHPGKEHQKFIPKVYKKIKELRKVSEGVKIQADGGVNLDNAGELAKLRVGYVNSGSFVSDALTPKERLIKLNYRFLKRASGSIK